MMVRLPMHPRIPALGILETVEWGCYALCSCSSVGLAREFADAQHLARAKVIAIPDAHELVFGDGRHVVHGLLRWNSIG